MRSGGVVGLVQEKAAWYRQPVPTRHPQPLSQGLTALPAPLTQGSQALRGTGFSPSVACGDSSLVRGSQALRGTKVPLRGSQALRGDRGLVQQKRPGSKLLAQSGISV